MSRGTKRKTTECLQDCAKPDICPSTPFGPINTEYSHVGELVKSKRKERAPCVPSLRLRPNPEECRLATAGLASLHPQVVARNDDRRQTLLEGCGMRASVTDAVISTMLSQNTTDANSKAAFASLKKAFPGGWDEVATCDDIAKIESAIRVAGLAKTRASRIQSLLRTLKYERGQDVAPSLEYLRSMSNDEVKIELSRFKGLGPKTISCVLLFALGRPEFPVDTHVLRITRNLGWVPSNATRESAYEHLNATVPDDVKMDLHCLLVTHGKHCHRCAANGKPQFPPKKGGKLVCPLVRLVDPVKWKEEDLCQKIDAGTSKTVLKDEEMPSKHAKFDIKVENKQNETENTVVKKEED